MKGRVARQMGNHELMITELILENILTEQPPEMIAAMLSALVFQQKRCSDPKLTPDMEKVRK